MSIDYRIGDTRDLTRALPDGSVHLVATSPPFLALRSYLPADHEHKHAEIGSEPDPATFIDTLLALTAEWGRVLAPWGSIAIELGDTFAGSGGAGGNYNEGGLRDGQHKFNGSARMASGAVDAPQDERAAGNHRVDGGFGSPIRNMNNKVQGGGTGWPRAKSLALIPQLYATSLAYGRNLLTGAPSPAGQWLVRNVIVWHRPNPAVGALGDKYRPSTSYIVVATRSPKRWFDLTAVRTAQTEPDRIYRNTERKVHLAPHREGKPIMTNTAGAPPLDCWFDHDDHDTWTITTQPSRLAHYAMWPAKLAERLILSMCPAEVCAVCGEPRRRMERATDEYEINRAKSNSRHGSWTADQGRRVAKTAGMTLNAAGTVNRQSVTLGWTDCGHDAYAPGVVLDPFAGTGTTLAVADLHGRHGIGFDIDARNAQLMDARRAEVARNLFGTAPEIPGQLDIFDSTA